MWQNANWGRRKYTATSVSRPEGRKLHWSWGLLNSLVTHPAFLPIPPPSRVHLSHLHPVHPPRVFSHLAHKVKSTDMQNKSRVNLPESRDKAVDSAEGLHVGSFVIVGKLTPNGSREIGTILVALRGTSFGMHGNSWRVYSTGAGSTSRKIPACFKGPMYRSLTQ